MVYVRQELEGCSVNATYTPDISIAEEPGQVSLPGRLWQVWRRRHPSSTWPASQVYLIHLVGGVEELTIIWQISAQCIQLVGSGIIGNSEVRPTHRECWTVFPCPGC